MNYESSAVGTGVAFSDLASDSKEPEMTKQEHIRLLGWLHLAYGALILLGAVLGLLGSLLGGIFSFDFVDFLVGSVVGVVVMVCMALFSLPSLAAGKGLLEGKGWARVLAMVMGALAFFSFPIGTALCVYTFWVLWGKDADPYFEGNYPSYHERSY
jgi:hypothetical protein